MHPTDCNTVVSRLAETTEHSYDFTVERVTIDSRQVLRNHLADEILGRRYVAVSNYYCLLPP